ncbi:TPA: transporter, partial [Pseudomonas aeruginosa]|nr:transporter [Pseudomonas aeruginosa]
YDTGQTLNIGENRWKAIFQFGGTYQLSQQLDAEGAVDATLFGKNKKFGASGADTLQQKALYQLQGSLNWHQGPGTLLAAGLSHTFGGIQRVNGVSLENEITTTKATLTASTFVSPSLQVLVSVGRDLKVGNGFKESSRLNVRLLQVF